MSKPQNAVIIGGGLAGVKTAEALRKGGFDGAVTIIAAESHLPYERPPLSKNYLLGKDPFDKAIVKPQSWFQKNDITLSLGTRAVEFNPDAHTVTLDNGTAMNFDKLVLATGAEPRKLQIPGADAPNVHYLRNKEDSDAIKATFGPNKKLVIIGGGWIGLEVAAAAQAAGTAVTVLERGDIPLKKILGEEIASLYSHVHRSHGVKIRTNVTTTNVTTINGRATGVQIVANDASGEQTAELIQADAVVAGVGAIPVVDIAERAGLAVDNGVVVDSKLQTSHPDVFAVGDIANHDHPVLGYRVRVEHWATALKQPRTVAAVLLGDLDAQYRDLPYFYSDQYDLNMEYVGHAPAGSYDRVLVRGDLTTLKFVAFWVASDDTLKAVMAANTWDIIDNFKPLIADRKKVDPAKLVDPSVPFNEL